MSVIGSPTGPVCRVHIYTDGSFKEAEGEAVCRGGVGICCHPGAYWNRIQLPCLGCGHSKLVIVMLRKLLVLHAWRVGGVSDQNVCRAGARVFIACCAARRFSICHLQCQRPWATCCLRRVSSLTRELPSAFWRRSLRSLCHLQCRLGTVGDPVVNELADVAAIMRDRS